MLSLILILFLNKLPDVSDNNVELSNVEPSIREAKTAYLIDKNPDSISLTLAFLLASKNENKIPEIYVREGEIASERVCNHLIRLFELPLLQPIADYVIAEESMKKFDYNDMIFRNNG